MVGLVCNKLKLCPSLHCSRGEYSCLPSSAFQEPIKCLLFCTWLLLPPPSCKLAAFCDKKPLRRCKRINWGRPWWHRNVATSSLSSLLKSDHEWDSLSLSPGPGLVVGLSRAPARDTQMHNSQHSRVAAHTGGVVEVPLLQAVATLQLWKKKK